MGCNGNSNGAHNKVVINKGDIVSGKVFRSNLFEFVNSSSGNLICSYLDSDILDPDKTFLLIFNK